MRIQLDKISKQFGKVTALRELQLDLPSGAKIALIGPNGSGKTTLMRVLLGLVRHRGEVRIDGIAARDGALASRIAYVPQIAPQMAATCSELVRAITDLRGIEPRAVRDIATRLELHLDVVAALPFRSLSGGSKQKLLIALALASRPELLILDEPTASLDAEARGRFFELQAELAGDATLILCSHRLEEIRSLVDHVVALEEGRLIYDGDAASYLAQRVGSLLELRVTGAAATWLSERGFAAGANGWWSRSVDRADKLALVPEALTALGSDLVDLVVRDIDLVEHRAGRPLVMREVPWFKLGGLAALAVLALVVVLVVRGSRQLPDGVQPIDWNREQCAHCQMLVGEPAHAVQLITLEGDLRSFDDPGCALRYLEAHDTYHQLWFHHHRDDRWLDADHTAFLTGGTTPMGSGLLVVERGTEGSIDLTAARQVATQPTPHGAAAPTGPSPAGATP